jgi:hypothetical protein
VNQNLWFEISKKFEHELQLQFTTFLLLIFYLFKPKLWNLYMYRLTVLFSNFHYSNWTVLTTTTEKICDEKRRKVIENTKINEQFSLVEVKRFMSVFCKKRTRTSLCRRVYHKKITWIQHEIFLVNSRIKRKWRIWIE